jgi:glucose/arabinose dehydrogenase
MPRMQFLKLSAAALASALLIPAAALAQGPPPPTAVNGTTVQTVASAGSIQSPVAFAFGAGKVFVASGGAEDGSAPGGIYTAGGGTATKVPNSPKFVGGLVWHKGVLYVSGDGKLLAYSGWNGSKFAKVKTLFKGPKHFSGFGGITWHKGRIWAGVMISNFKYDSRKSPQPYAQSVVSLKPNGKDIRVFATGLREPWQLTFVRGIKNPFVSVLAQDNLKKGPPDYIIHPHKGDDYGFPKCNWNKPAACKPYARPYLFLAPHVSPMGIGAIGKTIYVALFGKQEVDSFKVGGKPKPFLTGFAAPVTGLGTHSGSVYASDLTGAVYRVKP